MRYVGIRSRRLYSGGDRLLDYRRAYYYCDDCGCGRHPDDEKEGVNEIGITPRLQEIMSLFGMNGPYDQSVEEKGSILQRVLHVKDLSRQMQRVVKSHGSRLRALRDCELAAERTKERPEVAPAKRAGRLVVEMDGGMLHSDGRWREVKNGVIYWDHDHAKSAGGRGMLLDREIVSTLSGGIERFRDQMDGAILKMGGGEAKEMLFLGDGAEWIWRFKDDHYPDAVEILDFTHAKDYASRVAEAMWPEREKQKRKWLSRQIERLYAGDVGAVLCTLKRLEPRQHRSRQAVGDAIRYYENNRHRMDYAVFRERGWPIGSGAVESSHKWLIQSRMKQAGMRWKENGAEAIINLRVFWHNKRWDEVFRDTHATAA